MSENYHNWERLVEAVLRRQHDREIALCDSPSISSISSTASSSFDDHRFSSVSNELDQSHVVRRRMEVPMDYSELTLDHSEWKRMLPPDEHEVVWRSASLSFFLDQSTGKNCFLLGPEKLTLSHGNEFERCWEMKPHPKSRFLEVAVLLDPSVFDIQVSINAKQLSPETAYAAYLVFGFEEDYSKQLTVISLINLSNNNKRTVNSMVQFEAADNVRADEWMELKLGEFYVGMGDNNEVQVQLCDRDIFKSDGLIVEGIEFRPLKGKIRSFKSPSGKTLSQSFPSSLFHAVFNLGTLSRNYITGLSQFPNLIDYSYSDLRNATRNFKADMVLDIVGFGTVYKGWVDEKTLMPSKLGTGMMVAIKKLNPESVQGFKDQWQSALNFLGRLSHPNLVSLLGYCREDKELLFVYELMEGNLEDHLYWRNAAIEPFSWDLRLKICIGAARGLAFLHTSEKKVIYRHFKTSSILLDGRYNAKISNFGLATLGLSMGCSHATTYGYAARLHLNTSQQVTCT